MYRSSAKWWFCVQSSNAAPEILLVGNSYANELFPGLVYLQPQIEGSILNFGTCPFRGTGIWPPGNPCYGGADTKEADFIIDFVGNHTSIRTIIIAGNSMPDLIRPSRLIETMRQWTSKGLRVIFVLPLARPNHDPLLCFSSLFRSAKSDCRIPHREILTAVKEGQFMQEELTLWVPGVKIFDPNLALCDTQSICDVVRNGLPMFRDYTHLSEFGSQDVAKFLLKELD